MATRRLNWNLNAPMFNYRSRNPGNLTVDYSTGADHRWPRWVTCGPRRTGVTLPTTGATLANTNAFALIPQASDTTIFWLYVAHGDKLAKMLWEDFTAATNQPAAYAERITDLLVTQDPDGAYELSAFMEGTAYRVRTTIAATNANDTESANNESKVIRIAGDAGDRIAGLSGQKIYGNVLTSTVTMDASSWQELATITVPGVVPTGFEVSNGLWIPGYNIGPFMLNSQNQRFFPLLGNIPADENNCRAMRFVEFMGVLIPLNTMLRVQNGSYGERVGPELYGTPNPIQGTVTAIASDANSAYLAFDNPNSAGSGGGTYLVAAKPGADGKPDYYGIAYQTEDCEAMEVFGGHGVRDRNTLVVGLDDDMAYYSLGNLPVWPDDPSYPFMENTDQTIYGTDWYPPNPVIVDRIGFELPNAASGQTVAAGIRGTTATGQQFDQVLTKENRKGLVVYEIPPNLKGPLVHYQPYFTLRTSSTSATPKLTPQFWIEEHDA